MLVSVCQSPLWELKRNIEKENEEGERHHFLLGHFIQSSQLSLEVNFFSFSVDQTYIAQPDGFVYLKEKANYFGP